MEMVKEASYFPYDFLGLQGDKNSGMWLCGLFLVLTEL